VKDKDKDKMNDRDKVTVTIADGGNASGVTGGVTSMLELIINKTVESAAEKGIDVEFVKFDGDEPNLNTHSWDVVGDVGYAYDGKYDERIADNKKGLWNVIRKAFDDNSIVNPTIRYSHARGFHLESGVHPEDADVLWSHACNYVKDGPSIRADDFKEIRKAIIEADFRAMEKERAERAVATVVDLMSTIRTSHTFEEAIDIASDAAMENLGLWEVLLDADDEGKIDLAKYDMENMPPNWKVSDLPEDLRKLF